MISNKRAVTTEMFGPIGWLSEGSIAQILF